MKGTLVEDINYLHRMDEMFEKLLPPQRRKSQALMMMGDLDESQTHPISSDQVPPGSSRKVLCPLLSGVLSATQPSWIPLKMAPLTIELEINPL